jgi:hypothetical protein
VNKPATAEKTVAKKASAAKKTQPSSS